jgi:hypothetical protein
MVKFVIRFLLLLMFVPFVLSVHAQSSQPLSFSSGISNLGTAPVVGLKANLFYGGYTQTPNLGFELGLGARSTLDVGAGYNPWNLDGSEASNKKLVHVLGNIEYRYWLCERFNGHFFGVHLLGSSYNIAEHDLPLLFGNDSRKHRFEGWAAGAGISYGYQFVLGRRWKL